MCTDVQKQILHIYSLGERIVMYLRRYPNWFRGFQGYDFWPLLLTLALAPNIAYCVTYSMNRVACNSNCHIENERLHKVTCSHFHCKSGKILEIVLKICCY